MRLTLEVTPYGQRGHLQIDIRVISSKHSPPMLSILALSFNADEDLTPLCANGAFQNDLEVLRALIALLGLGKIANRKDVEGPVDSGPFPVFTNAERGWWITLHLVLDTEDNLRTSK